MRNKILSITIAGLILAGFLLVNRFLRGTDHGQALASAGLYTNGSINNDGLGNQQSVRRKVSYNPDVLLELNAQHVRGVFDEPGLVRYESPITIWQYRTGSCVLDLYFTGKADDTFKPVVHYEVRAREKGVRDEDVQSSCVRDLVKSKNGFHMVGVSNFYKSLSE